MPPRLSLWSVLSLAPLAAACSSSSKAPALAPSGGHAAYAVHYGEELGAATKAFDDAREREKALSSGFGAHVDQLKKPDWSKVQVVVRDSDEAGKSADFADAEAEAVAVKDFWDDEKGDVTARVNGAVQDKLKDSSCNAEGVAGAVAYSLNDAIAKKLQKRLRARNDAFVVIERYKTSLGPQNVAPLEKLADDVAEASYTVHVLMPNERARLQRLIADESDVKKTLDRTVEEETAFQAEPGRTDAEKKASQDRIAAAQKAKAEIDQVAAQANATSKDMDKTIDAATKDYDDARKALEARIEDQQRLTRGTASR